MHKTVIQTHELGKRYRVRGGPRYLTLRDTLAQLPRRLLGRRASAPQHSGPEHIWALRDVSLQIEEGEVVGIVGRNGSGKSTLLKLLSRITQPTEGEIRLDGRVGSLLEVGTGFHPELTGSENIYMNGAILGMSRKEINSKFDEIVAFAGLGDFLEMPVKRYSTGMFMRLAFSVAAHLEPEILVVDEVLAVGDADFQQRCLGKMKDVSKQGRTVLFVSHNTNAVQSLCSRVVWLNKGHVVEDSQDVHGVTSRYLFGQDEGYISGSWIASPDQRLETSHFSLEAFSIVDSSGNVVTRTIRNDEPVAVEIKVHISRVVSSLNFGFAVINEDGVQVYWSATTDTGEADWPQLHEGLNVLRCALPTRLLNEGFYRLDLFASLHAQGYFSEPANTPVGINLRIKGGLSESPYWREFRGGVIAPVLRWENVTEDAR